MWDSECRKKSSINLGKLRTADMWHDLCRNMWKLCSENVLNNALCHVIGHVQLKSMINFAKQRSQRHEDFNCSSCLRFGLTELGRKKNVQDVWKCRVVKIFTTILQRIFAPLKILDKNFESKVHKEAEIRSHQEEQCKVARTTLGWLHGLWKRPLHIHSSALNVTSWWLPECDIEWCKGNIPISKR